MKILCMILITLASALAFPKSLIDEIDLSSNDRTDVLAIYKNDTLVYEEFRHQYTRHQKHKLWSVSKSITGLLVARAVEKGLLNIHSSICDYVSVSHLSSVQQCEVTLEDILHWQSGTEWSETYIGWNGSSSNVLSGLYGEGISDFASYYFSLSYSDTVENNWNYSTGDSHILMHILRQVYSPMEYDSMPWRELFDPLGISDATFERDHTGLYLGGAYIFLSHPSLYKIGQMVSDELKQPHLLPVDWMQQALTPRPNALFTEEMIEDEKAPAIPAAHWWVNRPANPDNQTVPWPRAPTDTFAAFGVFGQMMFIIPSEDIVIIRLAQDIRGGFDKAHFLDVTLKYARENDRWPETTPASSVLGL